VHRDARFGICVKKSREEPHCATILVGNRRLLIWLLPLYNSSTSLQAMKNRYTPEEYAAELQRQTQQVASLAGALDDSALNWQPGPKSWSIGQCLDHLVVMNTAMVGAMREAVSENLDQLEPRQKPIEAASWLTRWYVDHTEPPPKMKLRAPGKIVPTSRVSGDVLARFEAAQQGILDFVREFGSADLGDVRYKNAIVSGVRLSIDTGLALMAVHNRRHLWQAEQVKSNAGFPR
jgi:DinB superfamily